MVDGKELHTPDEQRSAFAKCYEDLSVPKDHGYETAYLELCSVRHHLIAQLCEESLSEPEPFTTKEAREAAVQLNNKKAADELGLTGEHLKYSGCALIEDITDIFNEILQSKTIPDSFKSCILTPVLKKAKDPTNLDNYRRITVTPVTRLVLSTYTYIGIGTG